MKIKHTYRLIIWFALFLSIVIDMPVYAQADTMTKRSERQTFRIVSYNVENYFDYEDDSLKNDNDFLPEGTHHWTYQKYRFKQYGIAKVIATLTEENCPAIVGLYEVENDKCLFDLLNYNLPNFDYRFVHFESADMRGIDVALLFDTKQFEVIDARPIAYPKIEGKASRDLLYTIGRVSSGDTLHLFLCHMPSKVNDNSETLQDNVYNLIQTHIDSLLSINAHSQIIVMGDMNRAPQENLRGLHNLMLPFAQKHQGTYKFESTWECLDQFFVSPSLISSCQAHIYSPDWLLEKDKRYLGKKPKRTYIGWRYNHGFSDHLPIYLDIELNTK